MRTEDRRTTAVSGERQSKTTFVGRAEQLAAVHDALDGAFAGAGKLILLGGEPGIGKTRICEEAAAIARQRGAHVLWGRCYEGDGAPALWPWVQIVRAAVRDLDPPALRQALGDGAADIAQLVPELRRLLPDLLPVAALDSAEARFRVFDHLTAFLRRFGLDAPLLLVIDDLQGADPSSLLLLQFVTRELHAMPILLLATYRSAALQPDSPLSLTVLETLRASGTQRLDLSGLSEPEVSRLIELTAGSAPPPRLLNAVHRQTEGNPLFVAEYLRLLLAKHGEMALRKTMASSELALPPTVKAVIERRLAPLSEGCRALLGTAAVIGREFRLDVLTRAAGTTLDAERNDDGQPAATVIHLLQEAVGLGIISEVPGSENGYRFTHALMGEVLYGALRPSERARLHGRVGAALEQAADADEHLAELAHHFFASERDDCRGKAITYAQCAGDRAMALLAYEEAVRLYEMALRAIGTAATQSARQRCELLVALGEAQRSAGRVEENKRTLLEAAKLARELGERELLTRAALAYGSKLVFGEGGGTDETLVQLLEQALSTWGDEKSPLNARLRARLAVALMYAPDTQRRRALSEQALEMAREIGEPPLLAFALNARHLADWRPDNFADRLAIAAELIQQAERAQDLELLFQGRALHLNDIFEVADRAAIDEAVEALRSLAGRLREPFYQWYATFPSFTILTLEGRFAEAEDLAQRALPIGESVNPGGAPAAFGIQMYTWHIARAHAAGLAPLAAIFEALAAEYPAVPYRTSLLMIYIYLERLADARAQLDRFTDSDLANLTYDQNWTTYLCQLSQACAVLQDSRRAATLYNLLSPFDRSAAVIAGPSAYLGPVAHYLGMLATVLSRTDEAERHFQAAIEMNTRMRARPWLARTQFEYAAMLLQRQQPRDRERAAELLTSALVTARELDMPGLEPKIAALLAPPPPHVTSAATRKAEQPATAGEPPSPIRHEPPTSSQQGQSNILRRQGDYWTIVFNGVTLHLRDTRGLRYVVHLLRHPGRDFHVLDLVAGAEGASEPRPRGDAAAALLDQSTPSDYRRRLAALREELEEAERNHDIGRAGHTRAQIEQLHQQVASAAGLGDRSPDRASERARSAVAKRIKDVIAKIRREHPALAHHLAGSISTGMLCAYNPGPDAPVWQMSMDTDSARESEGPQQTAED
jgi:predicted ATPase